MPKAYSYLRFSSPEQMKGDSLRRQTAATREYATKHGLDLDETLSFQDLGISAFRGKNAEHGALGVFRRAVEDGVIESGSFLLIESLDRLSRAAPRKAVELLGSIVDEGITVVTLMDEKVYTSELLDTDHTALMFALIVAMRAHEESATKARRLKAAWSNKRAKATDKALTSRGPAWLRLVKDPESPDRRHWEVIEDRAEVVRRIFRMSLEGIGQNGIAEALNRDGAEPFGDGSRKAEHWYSSYVRKILYESPSVVGTYVPHVVETVAGKKRRKPLAPIEGYYPAVIDQDTFERVRAMNLDTPSPLRGRHASGVVRNILGGLARCPKCGGTMTRINKADGSRPYLVCRRAKAGAGCRYRAVRIDFIESVLQRHASVIARDAAVTGTDEDAQAELVQVQTNIEATEEALRNFLDALAVSPSAAITDRIRDTEDGLDELRAQERELSRRIAATRSPLVERRLDDLTAALGSGPLDIPRANAILRQTLTGVVVDYERGHLVFRWLHGGTSEVMYAWPKEEDGD